MLLFFGTCQSPITNDIYTFRNSSDRLEDRTGSVGRDGGDHFGDDVHRIVFLHGRSTQFDYHRGHSVPRFSRRRRQHIHPRSNISGTKIVSSFFFFNFMQIQIRAKRFIL